MDKLRALKYFASVAQTGSFTQSASAFSVPPSSLSRRIADLEESLGATLFKRSTRMVKLTEVGESYLQQVSKILLELEQSDEAVKSYQSVPMGMLHISSTVGFGERILLPLLDEFREMYSEITLDVHLSDELSTLSRDNIDLAIRGGYAPNERVVAIQLMENEFIPAASPAYLEKMGTPRKAEDLSEHLGLYFRTPSGPTPWICQINGQWQDVSPTAEIISNGGAWLLDKAIEGKGIIMMPRWVLSDYLRQGELVELDINPPLTTTQTPGFGIYLLYQKQRYHIPKIKVAVDFLVARIRSMSF